MLAINEIKTQRSISHLVIIIQESSNGEFRYYPDTANKNWSDLFGPIGNSSGPRELRDYIPSLFTASFMERLDRSIRQDGDLIFSVSAQIAEGPEDRWMGSLSKLDTNRILLSLFPPSEITSALQDDIELGDMEIKNENSTLKQSLKDQTRRFQSASRELDDFTYSVSHDLRAPLRRLDGFSEALLQDQYREKLDDQGVHYLQRIRQAANDMGVLVDNLLNLSRISQKELNREDLDLTRIVREVFGELVEGCEPPLPALELEEQLKLEGDRGLVKVMIQNLLQNAIKYSSNEEQPHITVGAVNQNGQQAIYIKDNGVGFDDRHSSKLFRAFQRLHSDFEFEGNGIGLATVKRIVNIHGGEVWAQSEVGNGATFFFHF